MSSPEVDDEPVPRSGGPFSRLGEESHPSARAVRAYRVARIVMPPLAVLGVVGLDLVAGSRAWSIPVTGLLDEPAHLLTAGLALSAATERRKQVWPWVLLGAVAIDVDHLPLYLWGVPMAFGEGRPVTHSLATALVLGAIAAAVPRVRTAAGALSAGVILHLLRDAATGPGVPLFWPVQPDSAFLPYRTYLVILLALAAVACVRGVIPLRRAGRSPPHPGRKRGRRMSAAGTPRATRQRWMHPRSLPTGRSR